eukprot:1821868-Prymnesium_polylepis.2
MSPRKALASGTGQFVSLGKLHGFQWTQTDAEVVIHTQVRGHVESDFTSDGFVCHITAEDAR